MPEEPVRHFRGAGGARLAYREIGAGRPLLLIHGFLSTAELSWLRFGHAGAIAALGYRVIMPDLRGHGDSAAPHDPAAYPRDVLTDDAFALVDQLGLTEYDLGGYSLGARTTGRMLARGAEPGRVIFAGIGLDGLINVTGRQRGRRFRHILNNLGCFAPGSPESKVEAHVRKIGGDPVALPHVLDTSVDTPLATLTGLPKPTLVLCGNGDDTDGAKELAAAVPASHYQTVAGSHGSATTKSEFGMAIADFLACLG